MRLYFPIVFSILLGQKSSAFLRRDTDDANMGNNNPLPTESDVPSQEDLSLWSPGTESGVAPIPTRLDGTELDLDPSLSSGFIANSGPSSCDLESKKQDNKIRTRGSEYCPNDQADIPPKGAELPNLEVPDILDESTDKASLEYSIPGLDLTTDHPMCTHKLFVTHVCCDGPTGPWKAEGYFASIEKCWPCTSLQISIKIIKFSAG